MYGSGVHTLPSPQIDTMRVVTVETISLPLRARRYLLKDRNQQQTAEAEPLPYVCDPSGFGSKPAPHVLATYCKYHSF